MYSLLLSLIYLSFVSLGLPDSLLGAGWPVMHSEFSVPISYMGLVTMIISGSTIVSSLFSDKLTRKLGTPVVTTASVFLTAVALLGFSFSKTYWMLLVFAVPYGLGAGAIDAALNNYVALHYSSKHMSWLHCFWGVGTIVSPFVMSNALANSVWNNGYRTVAYIQMFIGLILLVTIPVWKINKGREQTEISKKSIGLPAVFNIKGVPFILLGFFSYCAAESTAMGWASTYFAQVKGIDGETAAAYASLVFIGLTAGRFLAGFLMDKIGDRKMILLGTAVTVVGIVLLLLPIKNDIFSICGFVIVGLGYAPIYPCIIHSTPLNFGAENSGAIIGIQMAGAYLGSTFMPPLYGVLGKWIGYEMMPVYLLVFVGFMVIMTERTFKVAAKSKV